MKRGVRVRGAAFGVACLVLDVYILVGDSKRSYTMRQKSGLLEQYDDRWLGVVT